MKNAIVATILSFVLLVTHVSSSTVDVAELRRVRALEWNGHHGGDNGRDHPGMYHQNSAPTTSAASSTSGTTEGEGVTGTTTATTTETVALQAAKDENPCGFSGSVSQEAAIAVVVVVGILALAGVVACFMNKYRARTKVPASNIQTTAIKSVPVPTKDEEEALEDMTAASDSTSRDPAGM